LRRAAPHTHVLRDPTRGGLSTTLNEIALQSHVSVEIDETAVPIRPEVRSICDLLGFDPLYVANEGKLVIFVPEVEAQDALTAIRASRYGENAAVIGRVIHGDRSPVTLRTAFGTGRILESLPGEMLPRIC
ncbi:MAG TPA: AIR synthase-related protein, partial [Flexilinea sp.]|nr:AIR synthase-related protein [Flexilinea sp.]